MIHKGDHIVSISKLTNWLSHIARNLGVEVLTGFAAEDILLDEKTGRATGVKLIDQGLDHHGNPQRNYVPGETITADMIVLAEGCDGLLTEKFVQKAGLQRQAHQLFSVGIKELIEVSPQQYEKFGDTRVVHAMGYPIWTPIIGPGIFGGGIMYAFGKNQIAVGMIVGADWKYHDFNPQEALVRFKQHAFVNQFIEGGTVVEASAKMIPEGGYYAIPRDPQSNTIGKNNVIIIGDSAGFVNMLKIKGLHNAIASGDLAGQALAQSLESPEKAAQVYTQLLEASSVDKEMRSARKYRQTVAKLGNTVGFPVSTLGSALPKFDVEPDYEAMTTDSYKFKMDTPFDKDTFAAMARVEHREEQPCHCHVKVPEICQSQCLPKYNQPCIRFCPAGVYEVIQDRMKPANPSNCLHCKTCQNKCPYDNLQWNVPEGAGGPRYRNM
jgi:electron-transferring-flavoprotein dehydrogenase